jgi:hypothetical protein
MSDAQAGTRFLGGFTPGTPVSTFQKMKTKQKKERKEKELKIKSKIKTNFLKIDKSVSSFVRYVSGLLYLKVMVIAF